MQKIKVSFLERTTLSLNRTKDGIRGYEPAIIKTERGEVRGRVIDVDRLRTAVQIEKEIYSAFLNLRDASFDLSLLLETDEGGRVWLENFRKYFQDYFGQQIPMDFSVRKLKFPFGAKYNLYPRDLDLILNPSYQRPSGNIISLSDKAVYYEVLPPMRLKDGKGIPNLGHHRKVDDPTGFFEGCSIEDPTGEHFSVAGALLGELTLENLENRQGDFREFSSMPHYLEVTYPVYFRDSGNRNPLSIKFELVDN